jgi:hypothetical protein
MSTVTQTAQSCTAGLHISVDPKTGIATGPFSF